MSDNPPTAGHNLSEAQKLFAAAKTSLGRSRGHTKEAHKDLCAFLVHVMETCEYARQSDAHRREIELELHEAGILHLRQEGGDWFGALVTAAYPKDDREGEKTNISKYKSVLSYADRKGIGWAGLMKLLDEKPISEIVRLEVAARSAGKKPRPPKPDPALEAAIVKHRKPIELPGVKMRRGERFGVLVVESTDKGLCQVAWATQSIKEVRRYFADELPKRGRPRASA